MNVKRWAVLFALIAGLLWLAGCGTQSNFLGKNEPTPTNTRRPRPTFTPRPVNTDTPAPTDTPAVTDTAVPTDTSVPPTAKPVVKAPTAKPKPPTQPPAPTAVPPPAATPTPAFPYHWVGQKCMHSGGVYIEVYVYTTYPSDPLAGVKVRASYAPDAPPLGDVDLTTGDDGKAQYTLQTKLPAKEGTYYAWVINSSGQRISPLSQPIVINNKGEDDPAACNLAQVAFSK